jgi:serine/threonine-protein phosphatase PGAM5
MRFARRALAPAAAAATAAATAFAFAPCSESDRDVIRIAATAATFLGGCRYSHCDQQSEQIISLNQQIAALNQQLAAARSGKQFVEWDDNWDGLAKKGPLAAIKSLQKGPTRHILFIRHGQYTMAKDDKDRKLTDLGRAQARLTGERLATLVYEKPMPISKLYCSNMSRARETADIIAKQLGCPPPEQDALLAEGVPCTPSPSLGLDAEEADLNRLEAAFHKHMHRLQWDKKSRDKPAEVFEVVVCHGNVIRYFCCRLLQLPPESWSRFEINNCGITHMSIKPCGAVCMHSLGDTAPLPDTMVTFN